MIKIEITRDFSVPPHIILSLSDGKRQINLEMTDSYWNSLNAERTILHVNEMLVEFDNHS